jgi:hypothetical protein
LVIPSGMTDTQVVSVKVPSALLRKLPAAGQGRSRFIIAAIEEKVGRRDTPKWKPRSDRGKRMAAILARGKDERLPLLSDSDIEMELAVRKGRAL